MISIQSRLGQADRPGKPTKRGGPQVLAINSMVSVKGLLFNTTGTPTLVTRMIRQQHND